ncbi:MAG TPA: hypothetical protein VKC61_24620 [Pyrinomonadaceae bacterium]|nr:hypothetical protein [Pyrinomonadaceae bacterium]
MKILVIAALFSLLLLLLYSRIYPYLLILKKIFGVAKTITDSPAGTSRSETAKTDGKLVRCLGCGTWIPAGRALGNKTGSSVYCSRDCIEKSSNGKERKIAG